MAATKYPFEWEDIPAEELKACMPEAESAFIRSVSFTVT
jgi:hypothetical protein